MYSKRSLKQYKGQMVMLEYKPSRGLYSNKLSGIITANTTSHILFSVNKSTPEIILKYNQIISIEIGKK